MNHEVTLSNAQWCRAQASKYLKLANAIEEILKKDGDQDLQQASEGQRPLFVANRPVPSFAIVQNEAARGGRVGQIAKRLQADEQNVRELIQSPNSDFYVASAGWVRRKGEPDPYKKK
jgi:hypothetical protein